jgi:hypothetical protein
MNAPAKAFGPLLLLAAGALLAACSRQESQREIDWAKSALSRNPAYEIVATDESAGIFTVRDTATGEVLTLHLKDLIAAPLPAKESARPAPPEPAPAETPDTDDDTADALAQTTEPAELPGVDAEPPASGALAEGPGYSITRATGDRPEAAPPTLEGPGYKIERQQSARPTAVAAAQNTATTPNVVKRTDPIICQGNRLMRIDGETIEFAGDAVIAEKGCDLYITNARIRAGGVGIIARDQARVHIRNSVIGGNRGSYEASQGAEIYVASSTFEGIGRRFDGGQMTDLGGNSYATP